MYSNLRTVDGETNHLLVPATLDLTGLQADTVEILASSDADLDDLVGSGYAVVYTELREYADEHPGASVTYRRDGRVVSTTRIGDGPAGRGDVSEVSRRLQSFRVIDTTGAERCQAVFSPAR